ncbi:hypothetical protein [Sphaerisporangium aureirubrum]|uniref:Uncharacterized protein n=1 Tax=Sphaerisporangium aureirubrum TaxID=1544736 RepID=A0ABW1NB82_9ACTN
MATKALIHRCVLGIDIEKYSLGRTLHQQDVAQRSLDEILRHSAQTAGLDRDVWVRQAGGDGELAVLPPESDLSAVIGLFVRDIDDKLAEHNRIHGTGTQLRARMAIHLGLLQESALGFAGPALIVLSRLLNSRVLKAALAAASGADLALLLSAPAYEIVEADAHGLRRRTFRAVDVEDTAKGFRDVAYLHVAGDHFSGGSPARGEKGPTDDQPDIRGGETAHDSGPVDNRDHVTRVYGSNFNISGGRPSIKISERGDMYIFENTTDD